jgi:hypothetical protein
MSVSTARLALHEQTHPNPGGPPMLKIAPRREECGRNEVEHTKMATYEVMYSTKATSNDEPSFSDILLVEAETYEELFTKVLDTLLRTLGPPGNYYVDSIGDNPYERRSKTRIAKTRAKDYKDIVSAINALISKRNQAP